MLIPQGFQFAVAAAGFRYKGRDDLCLVVSDRPASVAGVFTTNRFQAAPVTVARELVARGRARALLVNAGQANACTGEAGIANCRRTLEMVGLATGLAPEDILPASTGVIGDHLLLDLWEKAVPDLAAGLGRATAQDAAKAIMTTDTFCKLAGCELELAGQQVRLLGMCKGAGMICPDMATMLSFVCCDAVVEPGVWQEMVCRAADLSFNRITVDGDTSTNDCLLALANGASGAVVDGEDIAVLDQALADLCRDLAYQIVRDAEGGTKVVTIRVVGAVNDREAEQAARTVAHSPLVKTAFFGQDPNWGRVVAALGRSGADFDPDRVSVAMCGHVIFAAGQPVDLDRDALLKPLLAERDQQVEVVLGDGPGRCEILTSDLTCDYVRINAEYRT